MRLSLSFTLISSAPATTCLLVRIQPFESKMKPEPVPLAPPSTPPLLRDSITTTAGMTRATAVITALDSSMCTWLTALPVGSLSVPLELERRRLETATAEREPETMAETSAIVITGTTPRERGSRGCVPSGDAPDQAGVSQVGRVGWLGGGP